MWRSRRRDDSNRSKCHRRPIASFELESCPMSSPRNYLFFRFFLHGRHRDTIFLIDKIISWNTNSSKLRIDSGWVQRRRMSSQEVKASLAVLPENPTNETTQVLILYFLRDFDSAWNDCNVRSRNKANLSISIFFLVLCARELNWINVRRSVVELIGQVSDRDNLFMSASVM